MRTQDGKPQCVIRYDQPDAREGQAGRTSFLSSLCINRSADRVSRRRWTSMSKTSPSAEALALAT